MATKSSVKHTKTLPNGEVGCYALDCQEPATRWADFAHNGQPRFVTTSYCDAHGELDLKDPKTTERRIRPSA